MTKRKTDSSVSSPLRVLPTQSVVSIALLNGEASVMAYISDDPNRMP
jgi:hypothetical protein